MQERGARLSDWQCKHRSRDNDSQSHVTLDDIEHFTLGRDRLSEREGPSVSTVTEALIVKFFASQKSKLLRARSGSGVGLLFSGRKV